MDDKMDLQQLGCKYVWLNSYSSVQDPVAPPQQYVNESWGYTYFFTLELITKTLLLAQIH